MVDLNEHRATVLRTLGAYELQLRQYMVEQAAKGASGAVLEQAASLLAEVEDLQIALLNDVQMDIALRLARLGR